MKRALIFGVTGQDGSYLAELLLAKGYEVHGVKRRSSSLNTQRLDHIYEAPGVALKIHFGDVGDYASISRLIADVQPDEVYNLAAQSHVRVSFDVPQYTSDVTAIGALRILDVLRIQHPKAKFYQASSSEMFGNAPAPQSEGTLFDPQSPYACSKIFAHNVTNNYRKSYGIYACSGILFNHESPRRGETFVTRKVAKAAARIRAGLQGTLEMGDLTARRDWGFAREYVAAMWLMLQQNEPDDYVIGTGICHSVTDLLDCAFSYVGLEWQRYVEINPEYFRPAEVEVLRADATKAYRQLGWHHCMEFAQLIEYMVQAELDALILSGDVNAKTSCAVVKA